MLNALNTAATGMDAQQKQVEVISNNIANADTVGFKKSRTEFQDLLYQNLKDPGSATSATTRNPTGVQIGVGVQTAAVAREHADGSLRQTSRDLDIAVQGPGFIAVQKGNGEIAYTRDGSLRISPDRRLVTSAGLAIIPEITVPEGVMGVSFSEDGKVYTRNPAGELQELGQMQLTVFPNSSGLMSEGGNLYIQTTGSGQGVASDAGEASVGRIFSGHLESSNVSPITEMTDLIRAQRVYELNSKVISSSDQMMSTLNQIR